MRVYVPSTSVQLQALARDGALPSGLTAFAVTPALREWYLNDDIEELEYAAMAEAAQASLRLVDDDPAAARRRFVVAADVTDGSVEVRDDLDRGVVRMRSAVPRAAIASIHADDATAEAAIAAAAEAIVRADLGDPAAQDAVDDAGGFELSWYATQELEDLLAGL